MAKIYHALPLFGIQDTCLIFLLLVAKGKAPQKLRTKDEKRQVEPHVHFRVMYFCI